MGEISDNSPIGKIAECAAVGASIVGVFASTISAQVAYVAVPVSLSLCLNLLNRYRWEKQTQNLSGAMARVYRRLDQIEQSLLASPSAENSQLLTTTPAWRNLQQAQQSTQQRLDKLTHEQSQLDLRISQISSQTTDLDREYQSNQRLISSFSHKFAHLNSSNGKDPNASVIQELQNRLSKIEEIDVRAQIREMEKLKQQFYTSDNTLEPNLQEQASAIAQIQERLLGLEGLEVENQLLEVLQLHLRLYKWQQELTAEINQRLTPVVVEMQLNKQRQLELETKVAQLAITQPHGNGKLAQLHQN
jgi:chromosome segregation ATPase